MTPPSRLRTLLVATALVALVAAGLGAGYYFASAESNFVITWSQNPLMIKFSARSATSGSAPDSFTCSPSVAPVTLKAQSSVPDKIALTVSPSAFSSCGSTPDNVVVTASCTQQVPSFCDGQYTGSVTVCGPNPYTCLKQVLAVTV